MEGGPPRFSPRFTGADLLRNVIGRQLDFAYGTIALCGARVHVLRLPNGLVTHAGILTSQGSTAGFRRRFTAMGTLSYRTPQKRRTRSFGS